MEMLQEIKKYEFCNRSTPELSFKI